MESQSKIETSIGTKETEKLKSANLKIEAAQIQLVKNKKGEEVGEKAIFSCKHPDKEDLIEVSKVKYLKGDSIKESATWYNEDEDDKIVKNSALAQFLIFIGASNVKETVGKEIESVSDTDGYLCFKAY